MKLIFSCIFFILVLSTYAQKEELSLDKIVNVYSFNSPQVILAKILFENSRLDYENYKKTFLPSISFNLSPINYNHSIRILQNPIDGTYLHIEDYSNNSNTGISIRQQIGITGGTLTVGSNLNMLSEFTRKSNSFNTTPYTMGYSQELFGGYTKYKKGKKIEESKFIKASKDYCSTITQVQSNCVNLFMNLLLANLTKESLSQEVIIADTVLISSRLKYENGYITEDEYLQMKLLYNNSMIEYEEYQNQFVEAFQKLITYLGISNFSVNNYQIEEPIFNIPMSLDFDIVFQNIKKNNPFDLELQLKRLVAEQNLYNSITSNKFNASFNFNYGLNQYANVIGDAYKNPSQQQSIILGFSIPIFRWGINENNLKLATNQYQSTLIEINNLEKDFKNSIIEKVNNYNYKVKLYFLYKSSYELAQNQYKLLAERFCLKDVAVFELSSSNRELISVMKKYYASLYEVWQQYYAIRNLTQFDFILRRELDVEILNNYKEK